ncbi:hypothetical protein ILUMI_25111 [Ignelater luminosus]|uniref:Cationic amino acid transporter n=1 Tax=Ignelater luminosus TaxID=2038154 RepID=A0A8K0CB60_IGNLU|nr:hypothetical protein ILUMI_25111 [Ignelater luminosus]
MDVPIKKFKTHEIVVAKKSFGFDLINAKILRELPPDKCLTTLDLTSLGVGSCVGTGMYLVSGMVARNYAGPGVVFSFIIAAVASIFSGACYAEFGVRVPHTTGSAYMYSYVTVGEFIAFVIGWNMILEYLIGTSACACALSACFNALTNDAISNAIAESVGTMFGRPPDFLAFVITLLMMLLLAAGVKKSLIFNNVLNAINLAVWVFIMGAGMFYVNSDNWSQHNGFLPYGWSGLGNFAKYKQIIRVIKLKVVTLVWQAEKLKVREFESYSWRISPQDTGVCLCR